MTSPTLLSCVISILCAANEGAPPPVSFGTRCLRTIDAVTALAFSPDGTRLAVAGLDPRVSILDPSNYAVLHRTAIGDKGLATIGWWADGSGLYATTQSGLVLRLGTDGARTAEPLQPYLAATSVLSPAGNAVASTGRSESEVDLADAAGKRLGIVPGNGDRVARVAFSPDGRRLAIASWKNVEGGRRDGVLVLADVASSAVIRSLETPGWFASALCFAAAGEGVLAGGSDGVLRRLADDGASVAEIGRGHHGVIAAVAVSADGDRIATGGVDRQIALYDQSQLRRAFPAHRSTVSALAFAPDGKRVVSGSLDQSLRVWDTESGALLAGPAGHEAGVTAVAATPDGSRIATAAADGSVILWDATGAERARATGNAGAVAAIAFSEDGQRLATCGADGVARVLDATTGAELARIATDAVAQNDIAWIPGSDRLAIGCADSAIRVFAVASGELALKLSTERGPCTALAIAPGGGVLASASATLELWTLADGSRSAVAGAPVPAVADLEFSADGTHIAAACGDKVARLFAASNLAEERRFEGLKGRAEAVAIAPDGRILAVSCAADAEVRLFDLATGTLLRTVGGHERPVTALAFVGDRLLCGSNDQTATLISVR